jgi:hypothetical protein
MNSLGVNNMKNYFLYKEFYLYKNYFKLDETYYDPPNIAKMIELLEQYTPCISKPHGKYGSWQVEIWIGDVHRRFREEELLDALWKAWLVTIQNLT